MLAGFASTAWAEGWRTSAELSLGETFTDNANLRGGQDRQSDWVTEVAPGLRFSGKSARAIADVNVRVQGLAHTADNKDFETRLGLYGLTKLELVDDRVFFDGQASVSQERVSQLGVTNSGGYQDNNTTEVRRLNLTPYARWRLGDEGLAVLRYSADFSDSSDQIVAQRLEQRLSLDAQNGSAWGRLGWGARAESMSTQADNTRTVESDVGNLSLFYGLTPTLRLETMVGKERNNFLTVEKETYDNYGGGFVWTPSTRTSMSARVNKRFFGWGRDYRLRHTMQQLAFELGYVRDAQSTSSERTTSMSQFQLFDSLLAQRYPDPLERALAVALLLQQNGISPDAQTNFLSNQYTDSRRLFAAVVARGQRNTLSLSAERAQRSALTSQNLSVLLGDFANYAKTREDRVALSWSSRLTGFTTSLVGVDRSLARGDRSGGGASDTRRTSSLDLGLSTTLGAHTRGGLRYRYTRSTGSAEYHENSVAATLHYAF